MATPIPSTPPRTRMTSYIRWTATTPSPSCSTARTTTFRRTSQVPISCSRYVYHPLLRFGRNHSRLFRMPTPSASLPRFRRCGTRCVHETLVTADAITARVAWLTSGRASRRTGTGSGMIAERRFGRRRRRSEAERLCVRYLFHPNSVFTSYFSCSYWNSTSTGPQWAAMGLISFNHEAMGTSSHLVLPMSA